MCIVRYGWHLTFMCPPHMRSSRPQPQETTRRQSKKKRNQMKTSATNLDRSRTVLYNIIHDVTPMVLSQ